MTSETRTAHGSRVDRMRRARALARDTSPGAPAGSATWRAPGRTLDRPAPGLSAPEGIGTFIVAVTTVLAAPRAQFAAHAVPPTEASCHPDRQPGTGTGTIIGVPTPRVSPSLAASPASPPRGVRAPSWRSILVFVVLVVTVASAGAIAAGGAAGVTIATLDQGLPGRQGVRGHQLLAAHAHPRPHRQGGAGPVLGAAPRGRRVRRRSRRSSWTSPRPPRTTRSGRTPASTWRPPSTPSSARPAAVASRGGGSTITQQLVRARLLPEDDRQRRQHDGGPLPAQGQGAAAGLQAHPGLPRRGGQEGHHHGLPQRDLPMAPRTASRPPRTCTSARTSTSSRSARPPCWRPSPRAPRSSTSYNNTVKEKYGKP